MYQYVIAAKVNTQKKTKEGFNFVRGKKRKRKKGKKKRNFEEIKAQLQGSF